MPIAIKPILEKDLPEVIDIVRSFWSDDTIVVHNDFYSVAKLQGLKALLDDQIVGLLHYEIRAEECEILTLASLREGLGVGSALISAVEVLAKENHCRRLNLVTTNDDLHALGFYQRRGFHITDIFPGQVDISRKIKPSIPEIGDNQIAIRDEIRLEKELNSAV